MAVVLDTTSIISLLGYWLGPIQTKPYNSDVYTALTVVPVKYTWYECMSTRYYNTCTANNGHAHATYLVVRVPHYRQYAIV